MSKEHLEAVYSMHGGYQIKKIRGEYFAVFKDEQAAYDYDRTNPEHFMGCEAFPVGPHFVFAIGSLH